MQPKLAQFLESSKCVILDNSYLIVVAVQSSQLDKRWINVSVCRTTSLLWDKSSRVVLQGISVGTSVRSFFDKSTPLTIFSSCPRNVMITVELKRKYVLVYKVPPVLFCVQQNMHHSDPPFHTAASRLWTRTILHMMTLSNEKIFSALLAPFWGEFTGHRWIPLTKAGDAELFSLICAWTNAWANHRDVIALIVTSL